MSYRPKDESTARPTMDTKQKPVQPGSQDPAGQSYTAAAGQAGITTPVSSYFSAKKQRTPSPPEKTAKKTLSELFELSSAEELVPPPASGVRLEDPAVEEKRFLSAVALTSARAAGVGEETARVTRAIEKTMSELTTGVKRSEEAIGDVGKAVESLSATQRAMYEALADIERLCKAESEGRIPRRLGTALIIDTTPSSWKADRACLLSDPTLVSPGDKIARTVRVVLGTTQTVFTLPATSERQIHVYDHSWSMYAGDIMSVTVEPSAPVILVVSSGYTTTSSKRAYSSPDTTWGLAYFYDNGTLEKCDTRPPLYGRRWRMLKFLQSGGELNPGPRRQAKTPKPLVDLTLDRRPQWVKDMEAGGFDNPFDLLPIPEDEAGVNSVDDEVLSGDETDESEAAGDIADGMAPPNINIICAVKAVCQLRRTHRLRAAVGFCELRPSAEPIISGSKRVLLNLQQRAEKKRSVASQRGSSERLKKHLARLSPADRLVHVLENQVKLTEIAGDEGGLTAAYQVILANGSVSEFLSVMPVKGPVSVKLTELEAEVAVGWIQSYYKACLGRLRVGDMANYSPPTLAMIQTLLQIGGIEPNPGPEIAILPSDDSEVFSGGVAGFAYPDFAKLGNSYAVGRFEGTVPSSLVPVPLLKSFNITRSEGIPATAAKLPTQLQVYHAIGVTVDGVEPPNSVLVGEVIPTVAKVGASDAYTLTETALAQSFKSLPDNETVTKQDPGYISGSGFSSADVRLLLGDMSTRGGVSYDAEGIRLAQLILNRNLFHQLFDEHFVRFIAPNWQPTGAPIPGIMYTDATLPGAARDAVRRAMNDGWFHCEASPRTTNEQVHFHGRVYSVPNDQRHTALAFSSVACLQAQDDLSKFIAVSLAVLGYGSIEDLLVNVPVQGRDVDADTGLPGATNTATGTLHLGANWNLLASQGVWVNHVVLGLKDFTSARVSEGTYATFTQPQLNAATFPLRDAAGNPLDITGGTVGLQPYNLADFVRDWLIMTDYNDIVRYVTWAERHVFPGIEAAVNKGMCMLSGLTIVPTCVLAGAGDDQQFRRSAVPQNGQAVASTLNVAYGGQIDFRVGGDPVVRYRPIMSLRTVNLLSMNKVSMGISKYTATSPLTHNSWYASFLSVVGVSHFGLCWGLAVQMAYDYIGLASGHYRAPFGGPAPAGTGPSLLPANALAYAAKDSLCQLAISGDSHHSSIAVLAGSILSLITATNIAGSGPFSAYQEWIPFTLGNGAVITWHVVDVRAAARRAPDPALNPFGTGAALNNSVPTAFAPHIIQTMSGQPAVALPGCWRPFPVSGPIDTISFSVKKDDVPVYVGGTAAAPTRLGLLDDGPAKGDADTAETDLVDYASMARLRNFTWALQQLGRLNQVAWSVGSRRGTDIFASHELSFYVPVPMTRGVVIPTRPGGPETRNIPSAFLATRAPVPQMWGDIIPKLFTNEADLSTLIGRFMGGNLIGVPTILPGPGSGTSLVLPIAQPRTRLVIPGMPKTNNDSVAESGFSQAGGETGSPSDTPKDPP